MIVAAYRCELGTAYINDEAYRDASPEELKRRREYVQQLAWDLAVKQAMAGIKPEKPKNLPVLEKLDMNDPEVQKEIREYEEAQAKRRAMWGKKRTPQP